MQKISAEVLHIKFKELIFPLLFFSALFDFTDLPVSASILGIISKINLGDIGTVVFAGLYLLFYRNDIINELKNNKLIAGIGMLFLAVTLVSSLPGNPFWIASVKYWIKMYLFFFMLIVFFRTAKFSSITINVLCAIFIIINLLGIIEFIYLNSPVLNNLFTVLRSKNLMQRKSGMASIFSNQIIYGTLNSLFFLTILLVKINIKKIFNNYLFVITVLLSLAGIFLSLSLNAILTLVLGCTLIVFKSFNKKEVLKLLAAIILSILLILVLSVKYNSFFRIKYETTISSMAGFINNDENSSLPSSLDARLKIWENGIKLFEEKPVFGWGTGMSFLPLTEEIGNRHLHDCYLEILVNNGLAGFILFIWLLSIWLSRTRRSFLLPLIIALLFSCLFDTFIGASSWLVFTAWIVASSTNGKIISAAELN